MRFKLYRTLITLCIFTDEETNAASVRIVTINKLRRTHSETDSKSGSQKLKEKNHVHSIGQKFSCLCWNQGLLLAKKYLVCVGVEKYRE